VSWRQIERIVQSSGSYPDERHSRRYLADESAVRHAKPVPETLSQPPPTGPIGSRFDLSLSHHFC
jgi:hypothetical protein